MTILGPETLKAVRDNQQQRRLDERNRRLAEIHAKHQEWVERQARIRAQDGALARSLRKSAWDAQRLHRYRSMGYSVRRLAALSGHPQYLVELGIKAGGEK